MHTHDPSSASSTAPGARTRRDVLKQLGALAIAPSCAALARREQREQDPEQREPDPEQRDQDRQRDPDRRPNVLVVISDQHRHDVAGFAGDRFAHTPALDRLAARGTILEQVYCQVPLCIPARQSLVTGRYAHEHSSFGNRGQFPEDQRTLPAAFREAGYRTALIGKAHCNVSGFESALELAQLYDTFLAEHPGGTKPGAYYTDAPGTRFASKVAVGNPLALPARTEGGPDVHQVDGDIARHAREWLAGHDPQRPFFLWVSFLNPHPPLFPPEEWMARYRDAQLPLLAPTDEAALAALSPRDTNKRRTTGMRQVQPEHMLGIARSYYASVAWMDHCAGEVLAQAEKLAGAAASGPERETIVLYTSDHGEMLGEHGLLSKNVFYEGAVRVPALLAAAGRVPAGRRLARVAQHVDLSATLLDLAGIPEPTSGRSLRALLQDPSADWEDLAFAELYDGARPDKPVPAAEIGQMVRAGRYKAFRYGPGSEALFDLQEDPGELVDRRDDPALREVYAALSARLRDRLPARVTVID